MTEPESTATPEIQESESQPQATGDRERELQEFVWGEGKKAETAAKAEPEAQKGEKEDSAPPAEEPKQEAEAEDERVPLKALKEERRLRQEEQAQRKAIEAELKQFREANQPTLPDRAEDPEGYAAVMEHRRIQASDRRVLAKHDDYQEKITVFKELAAKDPTLSARLSDEIEPAQFAYETAKAYLEQKALSDPTAKAQWEADVRKSERDKILAEQEAERKAKDLERNRAALSTPSLLGSGGGKAGSAGRVSYEDVVKR